MCDHDWILLTSKEYESSVWESGHYDPWDVQGCLQCKELQFRKTTTWIPLLLSAPEDFDGDIPSAKEYFKRLKLFHDTIGP